MTNTARSHALKPEQLRRACDPKQFRFKDTSELSPLTSAIGQERAARAIEFGISIESQGYHVFALGPSGTGKTSTISSLLASKAAEGKTPDDWCYVYDFADKDHPCALRLPPGMGKRLQADMTALVKELQEEIPRLFESEDYQRQRQEMESKFRAQAKSALAALEAQALQKGFAIIPQPNAIAFAPLKDGVVLEPEQMEQLDDAARAALEKEAETLHDEAREAMRQIRAFERDARVKLSELDKQIARFRIGHLFDELREGYTASPDVLTYLDSVLNDVLEHLDEFRGLEQPQSPEMTALGQHQDPLIRYRVNLMVDHSGAKGAPVIYETNPTYHNLNGRVEYEVQLGVLVTNFTMLKAGALHRANGGYLMLDAQDMLNKPLAWEALKRALMTHQISMGVLDQEYQMATTRSLEPQPIPLTIKVILIGDPNIYYLLHSLDEDFRELFKVKADFATHMTWDDGNADQYAQFIATVCAQEGLRHFEAAAVTRVIEHSARQISDQRKLATQFGEVADLVRQASYWAGVRKQKVVRAEDVQKALDEHVYRSNRIDEMLRDVILEGSILIQTDGKVVGQCNGLSVMQMGDYAFGKPSRITARTFAGTPRVVSIDREIELGGPIHSKGSLILAGYLNGTFAHDTPLSVAASITFEQMYQGVEGDSASTTELYALLSSLSGLPLRQDIAVTGSMNQLGDVQPIGGVNEKIEGFYDICRLRGLTGEQGVLIPQINVPNLMLREDVVKAVEDGKFHIYAVARVEDGISLLTGVAAGERQPDGSYPTGTVYAAIQARLAALAQKARKLAKGS